MLRRRRHVQILAFVVKLDFRIRIIGLQLTKGRVTKVYSFSVFLIEIYEKGGIMILLGPRKAKTICYSFTMRRHENMRDPPATLLAIRQPF